MQLHDFVDAVTADEPPMARTADDIVAAGRRAERRRRAGFASAGAAGLVVVAVAGAFVLPTFGAEQQQRGTGGVPAAAPGKAGKAAEAKWADAAPFTFTFQGYDAGSLHVQDPIAASTAFDPSGVENGKEVTVAGRKALQATLPVGPDPDNPVDEGNKLFAWEYADNAWAAVTSFSSDPATPSFEDLGGLVEGLKPSRPRPAVLPFTMGYVPSGYVPLQIGEHAMPGLSGIATAREGNYGGATFVKPAAPTKGLTAPYDAVEESIKDGFHIFVNPGTSSNQEPEPGRAKCYDGGFCNVWSADGKVSLQVSAQSLGNKLPTAELEKIAAGITVADVNDESTWTAAAEALK